MKTFLSILLIACTLIACKKDKPEEGDNVVVYKVSESHSLTNISYGGDASQKMDVYLPANRSATTKVFVMVHGGGWNAGDKLDFQTSFDWLKQTYPQHAIININYRLATLSQPGYDMQIGDIKSALAEISKSKYNVGTEYFFIGASAGAHLSMMYAYRHDQQNRVKGVCNIVGPADFTDPNYTEDPQMEYGLIYLAGPYTYAQHPEKWVEMSPVTHIKTTSPVTLSFYGGQDPLIPSTQVDLLNAKLVEKGVVHESYFYPNEGHGNWTTPVATDFVTKVYNFINTHFN